MSEDASHGCPDSSILAMLAEGTLDPLRRTEVLQHVERCSECPIVIAETVAFLRSERRENEAVDHRARSPAWWVAAAIVTVCVPAVLWQMASHRDPLRRVQRLAGATVPRPVEGRLTDVDYGHFIETRSSVAPRRATRFQAVAEELAASGATDPRALHARGLALLCGGEPARAVHLLTTAAAAERRNAAVWNDLSVAYIQLAIVDERHSLSSALFAADRAISLEPQSAAPHFNRGLALEHLGRDKEAVREYRHAAAAAPQSPWSTEAGERITRLLN